MTGNVERLQVEEVQRPAEAIYQTPQIAPVVSAGLETKQLAPNSRMNYGAILSALQAIAMTVAVRFLLLLALIGAFYLATEAMSQQTNLSLYILIAYCLLTVAPLVWLYTVKPR